MGQTTGIAWTDHTFNPWWGCQRVSPGCEHCYAEHLAVTRRKLKVWGPPSTTERQRTKGPWADLPKWNAAAARDGVRRRVFVASMADIFEDHPQVSLWRAEALGLLETCTWLDVQLLTKRPGNITRMVPPHWRSAWPSHVWVGTTVEDRRRAEERIPLLLGVPARVRFLSVEPLLEEVDLSGWLSAHYACDDCGAVHPGHAPCGACGTEGSFGRRGLQWIIVGGESGPGARRFDIGWARRIVAQCREVSVPVFVKQMGDNPVETERVCPQHPDDVGCGDHCKLHRFVTERVRFKAHHGADPVEWPEDLRVQEFPR